MDNKTVAIVQARMGSTRLPNKMMLHLHGYPVIEWIYRRLEESKRVDEVIFATSTAERDDVLVMHLESLGAQVFRGSEADVVSRFYFAAVHSSATSIVRVCADNPLICASEVDRLICFFESGSYDYAYNHIPKNNRYPDGFGAEICNFSLLEEIHTHANAESQREHLFNYVLDNKEKYKIGTFDPPEVICHPELRFDIDTIEDYKALLAKPYGIGLSAEKIIEIALGEA